MRSDLVLTECIGRIIIELLRQRVDIEEPANGRVMVPPLELYPVELSILFDYLLIQFPYLSLPIMLKYAYPESGPSPFYL